MQEKIIGLGVDLVDVSEIERLASLPGGHFVGRCFTELERGEVGPGNRAFERYAGRFAVKEAVLKALGVGWGNGIAWTDVETQISITGAPKIVLHRRLRGRAAEIGVKRWLVSTSHTSAHAVASVIAIGHA